MAYSKSPTTLIRREKHIQPMFRGETCVWVKPFPEDADAQTWAYKVRECLHVAKKNPERFPMLARLADSYIIQVENDEIVRAISGFQTDKDAWTLATPGVPEQHFIMRENAITFGEPRTRFEIVQALMSVNGSPGSYSFPNASLKPEEVKKLEAWCEKQEPEFRLESSAGVITIRR